MGRGLEGKMCVGFVAKKQLSVTESFIVSVDKYTHISEQMKRIVNAFQKFVVDSGEEVRLDMVCLVVLFADLFCFISRCALNLKNQNYC